MLKFDRYIGLVCLDSGVLLCNALHVCFVFAFKYKLMTMCNSKIQISNNYYPPNIERYIYFCILEPYITTPLTNIKAF